MSSHIVVVVIVCLFNIYAVVHNKKSKYLSLEIGLLDVGSYTDSFEPTFGCVGLQSNRQLLNRSVFRPPTSLLSPTSVS